MIEWLKKLRQHLLTGVSYAIPFVACGGILIAAALAFAPVSEGGGPDISRLQSESARRTLTFMLTIGVASFKLLLPILAMYIAYSIAGKPGLVAGAVGGFLCNDLSAHFLTPEFDFTQFSLTQDVHTVVLKPDVSAGFLGAIIAGLLAGYVVALIKLAPTHKFIKPIMPILIIPIVSSLIVGGMMILVLGPPIANFMDWMTGELNAMRAGNQVLLAALLGAMIAFDMGGPVNKVAFFFGAGLIAKGNVQVMGACAAAICTPPLGMGLATIIGRKLWTDEQRESGYAAVGMGMIGITEGAIPFAAADPLRVIPCIMFGSMVASVIAMLGGVGDHAPHGGPIVLPVVDNRLMYILAILAGTIVTALAINGVKKVSSDTTSSPSE